MSTKMSIMGSSKNVLKSVLQILKKNYLKIDVDIHLKILKIGLTFVYAHSKC